MQNRFKLATLALLASCSAYTNAAISNYDSWVCGVVEIQNNGISVAKLNYKVDGSVIKQSEFDSWASNELNKIYSKALEVTTDQTYAYLVVPGDFYQAVRQQYGDNDIRIQFDELEKP